MSEHYTFGPVGATDDFVEPEVEETEEVEVEEVEEPDVEGDALKKELRQLKAALRKANKQAADLRGEKTKVEDPDSPAALRREIQLRDAIEEVRDAGVTGSKGRVKRIVAMLSSVAPDQIADAIAELKEDFPELFGKQAERIKSPRIKTGTGADSGKETEPVAGQSKASQAMLKMAR